MWEAEDTRDLSEKSKQRISRYYCASFAVIPFFLGFLAMGLWGLYKTGRSDGFNMCRYDPVECNCTDAFVYEKHLDQMVDLRYTYPDTKGNVIVTEGPFTSKQDADAFAKEHIGTTHACLVDIKDNKLVDNKGFHTKAFLLLLLGMEFAGMLLLLGLAVHIASGVNFFTWIRAQTGSYGYQAMTQMTPTGAAQSQSQAASAPPAPPAYASHFSKFDGVTGATEAYVVAPGHPLAKMGYRFCPYTGARVSVIQENTYTEPKVQPSDQ